MVHTSRRLGGALGATCVAVFAVTLVTSCAHKVELVSMTEHEGMVLAQVRSEGVDNNLIGDTGKRQLVIYTPPGYDEGTDQYPVLYYLHGANASGLDLARYKPHLDEHFHAHPEDAFLVVGIDGNSKVGGSFWRNSPITGQWRTFAAEEVPRFVQENFRVSTDRGKTGIMGYSMGGGAAVHIAFTHPEKYGAVYSNSAGFVPLEEPGLFLGTQPGPHPVKRSIIASMAPEAFLVDGRLDREAYEATEGTAEVEQALLEAHSATALRRKVEAMPEDIQRSMKVHIEYGTREHEWTLKSMPEIRDALERTDLDLEVVQYEGGHALTPPRFRDVVIPFFVEAFGG